MRRIEAGENVSALARELVIKRAILYRWRDAYRLGKPEALRLRGQPSKAEAPKLSAARLAAGRANDLAESFIKTLKTEEWTDRPIATLAHARAQIGSFIEEFYNRQRLHSALDYLTRGIRSHLAAIAAGARPCRNGITNLTCLYLSSLTSGVQSSKLPLRMSVPIFLRDRRW